MGRAALCLLLPLASVGACAGILGLRDRTPAAFEHRAHVLEGIACVQCHRNAARTGARATLDLPADAVCTGCHTQPHDTRSCRLCHGRASDRHAALQAKRHLSFDHGRHVEAAQGRCVRCHEAVGRGDGPLRPTMAVCLSCHEHAEQWAERRCDGCHRDMEGEHVRPQSHVVHGAGFLRAHGTAAASARDLCSSCHTESTCASCHGVTVPALPSTLHFDQPERPDMHAAGFYARHSLEAQADPTLCESCHSTSSCLDCHRRSGLLTAGPERASPHPPGWVSTPSGANTHGPEARRDPVACASCHGGAGEQLCVGCHRVGGPGGNPHPAGFASRQALHELPCRMCHGESR
jgi:predicted CXXCH cytochrome family protein